MRRLLTSIFRDEYGTAVIPSSWSETETKHHFFETQVTFLGHVLTPDEVLPDPDNVEKIKKNGWSQCVLQMCRHLGMENNYW